MAQTGLALSDPNIVEFQYMMDRLKLLIANGRRLSNDEAAALAQFAVAEQLDPFSGECYLLKNETKNEIIGPMVGVKGLRRKAQEALGRDESYFLDFAIIAPPNTGILHAVECRLRDTKTMRQYLEMRKMAEEMFRSSGLPTPSDEAAKMVGPAPVWVGTGYFYSSEQNEYKDKKFHPLEKAKKRAEAMVLKLRFSMSYNFGDNGDSGQMVESADTVIINGATQEGDFREAASDPQPTTPAPAPAEAPATSPAATPTTPPAPTGLPPMKTTLTVEEAADLEIRRAGGELVKLGDLSVDDLTVIREKSKTDKIKHACGILITAKMEAEKAKATAAATQDEIPF